MSHLWRLNSERRFYERIPILSVALLHFAVIFHYSSLYSPINIRRKSRPREKGGNDQFPVSPLSSLSCKNSSLSILLLFLLYDNERIYFSFSSSNFFSPWKNYILWKLLTGKIFSGHRTSIILWITSQISISSPGSRAEHLWTEDWARGSRMPVRSLSLWESLVKYSFCCRKGVLSCPDQFSQFVQIKLEVKLPTKTSLISLQRIFASFFPAKLHDVSSINSLHLSCRPFSLFFYPQISASSR